MFLAFSLAIVISACTPSSPRSSRGGGQTSEFTPEEVLVNGQKFYHLRGCIKCHGRTGSGDGYRSSQLPPGQAPRDFKELASYKQGYDHESIAFTIKNGITNQPPVTRRGLLELFSTNTVSSSGMPAYPHLTDEEISHIAQYIIYLQTNQK